MTEPDDRVWRTDHAGASPFTIEPGHFEAEIEAVGFSYSDQSSSVLVLTPGGPGSGGPGGIGGELGGGPGQLRFAAVPAQQVTHAWTYGAMVLKAGILRNLDLEVSLLPWRTITTDVHTEPGKRFSKYARGLTRMARIDTKRSYVKKIVDKRIMPNAHIASFLKWRSGLRKG